MPSIVADRKSGKGRKAAELRVSLALALNHTVYQVERIAPGEDHVRAFRLVKRSGDGAVYDITQGKDGICRCDCPDYTRMFHLPLDGPVISVLLSEHNCRGHSPAASRAIPP